MDLLSILQTNQLVQGGVIAGIGVSLFHTLKPLPVKAFNFIKRRFIVRFTIHSDDRYFYYINQWLLNHSFDKYGRSYRGRAGSGSVDLGPDYGDYIFQANKKWYHAKVYKESANTIAGPSSTNNQTRDFISISCFGTSKKYLEDLVEDIVKLEASQTAKNSGVFTWNTSGGWFSRTGVVGNFPSNHLVLDEGIKESLDQDVQAFFARKAWYKERGIPYRRGYLLHGPPGTGKTSYIKHLAKQLNKDLYIMKAAGILRDGALEQALHQMKKGSILAIEDIDGGFLDISGLSNSPPQEGAAKEVQPSRALNLSEVLNALDGLSSPEDIIIVATTNRKESLDEALLRPGRFDVHTYIGNCSTAQAKKLYHKFFSEGVEDFNVVENTISPAQLQGLLLSASSSEQASYKLQEFYGDN